MGFSTLTTGTRQGTLHDTSEVIRQKGREYEATKPGSQMSQPNTKPSDPSIPYSLPAGVKGTTKSFMTDILKKPLRPKLQQPDASKAQFLKEHLKSWDPVYNMLQYKTLYYNIPKISLIIL